MILNLCLHRTGRCEDRAVEEVSCLARDIRVLSRCPIVVHLDLIRHRGYAAHAKRRPNSCVLLWVGLHLARERHRAVVDRYPDPVGRDAGRPSQFFVDRLLELMICLLVGHRRFLSDWCWAIVKSSTVRHCSGAPQRLWSQAYRVRPELSEEPRRILLSNVMSSRRSVRHHLLGQRDHADRSVIGRP